MRVSRTILSLAILTALPFPASAQIDQTDQIDKVNQVVRESCQLEGWQAKVEYVEDNKVRVELSPSLAQDKVICAYQVVSNWGLKIDGDVPVAVSSTLVPPPPPPPVNAPAPAPN